MTEKKGQPVDNAELRHRAEERLGKNAATTHGSKIEPLRLSHELQVHQIELEMQNAELRQTRGELETALEQYTDLYDFAPVGYFTLNRIGNILRVNLTGAGLLGVERSLLVGRRFGLFVTDEARPAFTACFEKVFTSPVKVACESILRREGNATLFVQVEGLAVASGQECRITLSDITERKQAEEELRLEKEAAMVLLKLKEAAEALQLQKEAAEALSRQKQSAEESARLKNQFLANMSHELRTPMTGILGMLQLALEEDQSPVLREYLETTLRSARSLLRILNDILDMAKFEAGKLIIEEKPFSLKRCIAEAVDIIIPEVRCKGLDLVLSLAEDMPETVVGDHLRLRQVLINLTGNAVKFTDVGKVEVKVTAVSTTSVGERVFTFAVTDTGIGIPENKKELLFRAFSQVDPSLSRKYGGTGLGLAISSEMVELMGGTISFVSEEGVGSTFSFTIPLAEAVLESVAHSSDKLPSSEATATAQEVERIPRLLLAEDDETIRQVLGLMLKRYNYNLDIAEDGLKAIEMWEKGEYDLILMDVQMPQLNGFEATSAIREKERERGSHIPIVAMTAHASKEDEENCLATGMDAYISKPINFKHCLLVIEDFIKPATAP
jgi:PAS domain S-box-containing protein